MNNNVYQSSAFFNSSNVLAGKLLYSANSVKEYFFLRDENIKLADENARLKELLSIEKMKRSQAIDTASDFLKIHQYQFIPAKVINNSTARSSNYLTLDKGAINGVKPGMGVISPQGVVGKVKSVSRNFSTVVSLLHERWSVSSKVKNGNVDAVTRWDGQNPFEAELLYVGLHHKINPGDTVITSGYNTLFPEGVVVGKIKEVEIDQGKPFYKIRVDLATDFTALSYVYVIDNKLREERDSLETNINLREE